MAEGRGFQLIDYIDFLLKRKRMFVAIFFSSFILTYVTVYVFVDEQYEATATIIPREDDASSLASGLLSTAKKIPFSLGGKSVDSDIDLYKTLIFSRTMMEDVIREFDLGRVYKLDTTDIAYMEKAVKRLRSDIVTKETEESAFLVTVRALSRQSAAGMANYIIKRLDDRIIEFKVSRSRDSKEFLQSRVREIAAQLKNAEDSLRVFQERTGLLDVKSQLQGIISANTSLETELTAKKIQLGILQQLYDKESPQVKELSVQIEEYEKRLINLRSQGDPGSPLLALKRLPRASVEYLRLYRDVELNNMLMEFVVPLYEQSRIEEKKDYPVLQIVDYAVPPAKKSYPPRTLLSLFGALSISLLVLIFLMIRGALVRITDPRVLAMLKEVKRWRH